MNPERVPLPRSSDGVAHDRQIRALLKAYIAPRLGARDLLVDEFGLADGDVRADLAVVNGALEGFEIKAGRDTLLRLPNQIAAYDKIFDLNWMVTTATHQDKVLAHLPEWWGLLIAVHVGDDPVMLERRAARKNPQQDARHLVRLLWRDELVAKLEEIGLSKGIKSKPKLALYDQLAEALPLDVLSTYVLNCLKARSAWRVEKAPR